MRASMRSASEGLRRGHQIHPIVVLALLAGPVIQSSCR